MPRSWSNVLAFAIAVTFSFFANARMTFKTQSSLRRYSLYVSFLGVIAYLTGTLTAYLALPVIVTLVSFSTISLIAGYAYSRFFVFR